MSKDGSSKDRVQERVELGKRVVGCRNAETSDKE